MRYVCMSLMLFVATFAAAQTFDAVVSGTAGQCVPALPLIWGQLEWVGTSLEPEVETDVRGVAPAPGGRVYAIIETPGRSPRWIWPQINARSS